MLNEVDLHITNRCNCQCKICCYTSNERSLKEMATGEAFQVIDAALKLGCSELHISGGEPLLRTDIVDICSYAIGRGLQLRLQTNGKLFSEDMAKDGDGTGKIEIEFYSSEDLEKIVDLLTVM